MAKVDQTNEQPSGSNWEVYKDVFAPEQTRNIVRGWERAPVTAQAPRLQGHKIWKRPSNKLQRNGKDKDDGQAELEKEGAGSRKRLRMMGAKQNIGNAPWMEAQGESENVGVASFLEKDILFGAETHVESMKENVAHDIASDALQFVPRKRTNINHVITPRKPLRQMTLNSEGQTQAASPASKSPAEKTRKRQSLRRSSRRVSLLEPAPSPRRISMQLPATTMFDNVTDSDGVTQSQQGRLELVEEGGDVVEDHTSGPKVDEESTDKIHITDVPRNLSEDIIAEGLNENSGAETEANIDFSKHETPEGSEPTIASPIPKKTPRSSRKTALVSAEAEQEPIKLAKTPRSSKKTSAIGADVEERTANSTRTPRLSKKNLSENVDTELEIDHPSKIPKPGKRALRRSTRNTRASSVNIEATASALQETSPSQSLESTISGHESNDIKRKTPEPQAVTPTTEPNPVVTEEPILAPPQDQESTENQTETLVTDDLAERERLIQETVTDLLIEEAREAFEAKDISPQEERLGADGQMERSEQLISSAEDNSEDIMRCKSPLREAPLLPPQEADISISKPCSADSPLSEASEASESSLVNFSPENAIRTFQFDLEVDVTSNQADVGQSASPFGIPDLAAIVDESTELVEDDVEISTPDPTTSELTETISTNAPLLSYDQDDTDMLRNFLTRVKANKAAKVEKSPKRKRSLPHSPLRLPLGESTETNLASPPQEPVDEFDLGLTKVSPPAKRRKRGGIVLEDEDSTETRSIRRSGRTRLPVKTPPSAPSFIPVRRMGQDGDNTVTLKRSEEKELAALTRVNTRKNKGGALSAVEVLAKKAEEKDDPVLRQRLLKEVFDDKSQKGKKKGKSVVWAEELTQYQESEKRKPDKEKEKEKKEKAEVVDDKKKNAVRVGIRSKIALGMAVNGTPAPKRKVKGRV